MKKQCYIILSIFVFLQTNIAFSASRESTGGGVDAATKIKLMLRQVMSEKEALNLKNIKLNDALNKLKSEVKNKENKIKYTNKKLKKSAGRGKVLSEKLQESYKLIVDLRARKKVLNLDFRAVKILNKNYQSDLTQCMKMNIEIFSAGTEVLDKYEKEISKSVEPVFKIKSVEIENIVQEYRFKMEDFSIPKDKIQGKIKKIENSDEAVSAIRTTLESMGRRRNNF